MDGENSLKRLTDILKQAREQRASDIHLMPGMQVLLRVDGELLSLEGEKIEPFWIEALIGMILTDDQKEILKNKKELEIGYSIPECCRLRVNLFRQRGTYAMAARLLPLTVPTPQKLGIPETVTELAEKKSGLILVTGTAGSGVTTTLAALVEKIAENETKAIVTIEEPVEYLYAQGKSMILQREVGADSISYAEALRTAARQDTDVIVIGKLQDSETVSLALAAAEAGCLVLAAAGENSVEAALERLVNYDETEKQICRRLARVFVGSTAQKLLPRCDGEGRVAAFEVVAANPVVRGLIEEGKIQQLSSILVSDEKREMQTLDDAIYDLYMKSCISADTAIAYARDPDDMRRKVQLF